jgi:hypothetical protein
MIEKDIFKKSSTSSSLIDVFPNIEPTRIYVREELFSRRYFPPIAGTECFFNAFKFLTTYEIEPSLDKLMDEVESYPLPPRRKFRILLKIKKIKKGVPSLCDEIEEI